MQGSKPVASMLFWNLLTSREFLNSTCSESLLPHLNELRIR